MRVLCGLGRAVRAAAGEAASRAPGTSPRRFLTDATSIAEETPRRPRPPSPRPDTGDPLESIV
jgi:hypothetical protein